MLGFLLPVATMVAVLAATALLLARIKGAAFGPSKPRSLQVIERVALGPKQGIAAIRVGNRVVLVSHGEGGVQTLLELGEAEWLGSDAEALPRVEADRPPPLGSFTIATAARRRLAAVRAGRFLTLGVALALCSIPVRLSASSTGITERSLSALARLPATAQRAPGPQEASAGTPPPTTGTAGLLQALPPLLQQEGEDGQAELRLDGPVGTAILLGLMALLPTLLLLATGFTRILIVLHLLKQAIGAQAIPPTHLVNALALLLTLFLMAPTLDRAAEEGITPWLNGEISQVEMFQRVEVPFRDYMLEYANEEDVARFVDLRGDEIPDAVEDVKLTTLIAAFTTSELRRAFQLGFMLFLPFIVIDLVVASVLMSMGMFMLPPVMISLPFKLLLFVLANGWSLVIGGLLTSFS